jgi:hypothetical protein
MDMNTCGTCTPSHNPVPITQYRKGIPELGGFILKEVVGHRVRNYLKAIIERAITFKVG